jgi:hypothetical protein
MNTQLTAPVTTAKTTRFAPPPGVVKKFTWSFSKLKNYEICPKRHNEIDNLKSVKDSGGEQLVWGNQVHDAMHRRLKDKKPLPPEMLDYEQFAQRVEAKHAAMGGELLVEQKYAITREFGPTGYFAPDVWYRGIADALLVAPPVALVIDWKTGKIQEDSVQLALMAQCILSQYPAVHKVASRFAWLKEHAETDDVFSRQDMVRIWPGLLERIGFMERSAAQQDYPPKPGKLCRKFCPVVSCPYHGKGT